MRLKNREERKKGKDESSIRNLVFSCRSCWKPPLLQLSSSSLVRDSVHLKTTHAFHMRRRSMKKMIFETPYEKQIDNAIQVLLPQNANPYSSLTPHSAAWKSIIGLSTSIIKWITIKEMIRARGSDISKKKDNQKKHLITQLRSMVEFLSFRPHRFQRAWWIYLDL